MHAARLGSSARLQRVHDLLSSGLEYSTLDILRLARVCAVNSIVAELRHGGAEIECRQSVTRRGKRVWLYRMTAGIPGFREPAAGRLPFGRGR